MNRKLTISLDYHSIYNAIQELNKEKEWRRRKIAEVTKALAEMGAEETNYGAMVRVEETENGFSIFARDDQIAFIEFGAGETTVELGTVDGVEINQGSWSRSELGTGEFARYGSWHYKKVKYTGLMPQRGMLRAEEAIIANVRDVIERVFRDG